jgi:FixJ family two-component response regulator
MTSTANDNSGTVYLVDDDPAIRASISDLLDSVGVRTRTFASAEDFLDAQVVNLSGCLLLDVRLPGMSGMEMQTKLSEAGFNIPIIIMTANGDMPMVRKALKSGAIEFLIKPFRDEELLEAVEQAFAVDRARQRAGKLMNSIQARTGTLTKREHQVMALVATGLTNKEVAEKLNLSVATIKLHRGQMMRKMEADTLADLVKIWERINSSGESSGGSI